MLNIFSFKIEERKELNENIKSILIGIVFIFLIFLTYYELTPQENGLEPSEGLDYKLIEEKLVDYPPKRIEQQKPNALTLEFIKLVKSSSLVQAIFAGHIHFPSITYFTDKIPQLVTGGNFQGDVNEIFVKSKSK